MLDRKKIEEATKCCLVKAGTSFRVDQVKAYKSAILNERKCQDSKKEHLAAL